VVEMLLDNSADTGGGDGCVCLFLCLFVCCQVL
jgi:hypothetical protein